MKQIFDIYGKFLLEAAIVITLILLLFIGLRDGNGNQGVFKMVGAKLPLSSIDYAGYTDYNSYQAESVKQGPVIRFQAGDMIKTGSCYKLSDYIIAEDAAANNLQIRVVSVKNADDIDITDECNLDTTEIVFQNAGIYKVTVSAKDDMNRKNVKTIQILVNE